MHALTIWYAQECKKVEYGIDFLVMWTTRQSTYTRMYWIFLVVAIIINSDRSIKNGIYKLRWSIHKHSILIHLHSHCDCDSYSKWHDVYAQWRKKNTCVSTFEMCVMRTMKNFFFGWISTLTNSSPSLHVWHRQPSQVCFIYAIVIAILCSMHSQCGRNRMPPKTTKY